MFKNLNKLPNLIVEAPKSGFFRENRRRLLEAFKTSSNITKGFLFFKGPIEQPVYDDDTEFLTIPEAHFTFLFGVMEPETYGLINIETGHTTLLVKVADPHKSFWMKIKTLKDFAELYEIEEALPIDELKNLVADPVNKENFLDVYVLAGVNPLSQRSVWSPLKEAKDVLPAEKVHESTELYQTFVKLRGIKTEGEMALIKQATKQAEVGVLGLTTHFGEKLNELQLSCHYQSIIRYLVNADIAYEPLVSIGSNIGIENHKPNKFKFLNTNELVYVDLTSRAFGYCGGVGRTLPISGKFSEQHLKFYQSVEKKYKHLQSQIKAGVTIGQLKKTANSLVLDTLEEVGIISADAKIQFAEQILSYFALSQNINLIGLDKFDPFLSSDSNNLQNSSDVALEDAATAIVSFGVLFNRHGFNTLQANNNIAPHLNFKLFEDFIKTIGGVRIADIVVVRKDHAEVISTLIPTDAKEIEGLLEHYAK